MKFVERLRRMTFSHAIPIIAGMMALVGIALLFSSPLRYAGPSVTVPFAIMGQHQWGIGFLATGLLVLFREKPWTISIAAMLLMTWSVALALGPFVGATSAISGAAQPSYTAGLPWFTLAIVLLVSILRYGPRK